MPVIAQYSKKEKTSFPVVKFIWISYLQLSFILLIFLLSSDSLCHGTFFLSALLNSSRNKRPKENYGPVGQTETHQNKQKNGKKKKLKVYVSVSKVDHVAKKLSCLRDRERPLFPVTIRAQFFPPL